MTSRVLGRTNRPFPLVWLRLTMPPTMASGEGMEDLIHAARSAGVPIDISASPALFGGHMRAADEAILIQRSTVDYERATDEKHAADLIQAHLLQTLSALGRESVDFYFLRVRRAVEERQISGVLEAFEMLRQEGHFKYAGICCDGPSLATLGLWQFHDAFDVVLTPRNHHDDEAFRTLDPVASKRHVGMVTAAPTDWGFGLPFASLGQDAVQLEQAVLADLAKGNPVLVNVSSAEEVERALQAPELPIPSNFAERISALKAVFENEETWDRFAKDGTPVEKAAAERRRKELG